MYINHDILRENITESGYSWSGLFKQLGSVDGIYIVLGVLGVLARSQSCAVSRCISLHMVDGVAISPETRTVVAMSTKNAGKRSSVDAFT